MGDVKYLSDHTRIGKIQQKMYQNRPTLMGDNPNMRNFKVHCTESVVDSSPRMTMTEKDDFRFLRAKNTTNVFKVDREDWDIAKHVAWYENQAGDLVTIKGRTYEDYVGIVGARKYPLSPRDKRREHYHNC